MKLFWSCASLLLLVLFYATRPLAAVIRVPTDQPTIQGAIDMAQSYDTVFIAAGTYTGAGNRDLSFHERPVFVTSSQGAGSTTIDIAGSISSPHRGLVMSSPFDTAIYLSGITFLNGYDSLSGVIGGHQGSVSFKGCTFRNNRAWGGGVFGPDQQLNLVPHFDSCLFDNNSATAGGVIFGSSAVFTNCRFVNHMNGGIAANSSVIVDRCVFTKNGVDGGSPLFTVCGVNITNSIFARNESICFSGSTWFGSVIDRTTFYGNSHVFAMNPYQIQSVVNCVIAFNRVFISCCCSPGHSGTDDWGKITLDYSVVYGNAEETSVCIRSYLTDTTILRVDPLMCDTTELDFSVAGNSPCIDGGMNGVDVGAFGSACGVTDINQHSGGVPKDFTLSPNYPNPFNPSTVIEYAVPTRSHVTLSIFNLLGQQIRILVDADHSAGSYKTTWDGTDSRGKSVASGIYFYRLESGSTVLSRKMLLLQ